MQSKIKSLWHWIKTPVDVFGDSRRQRLRKSVRMLIISRLDHRKDTCWSDMVLWTVDLGGNDRDYKRWRDVRELLPDHDWYGGVARCRADARDCGSCYCGKFVTQTAIDKGIGRTDEWPRFTVTSEYTDEDRGAGTVIWQIKE